MPVARAMQCSQLANDVATRAATIGAAMIGFLALSAGCGGSPPAVPPVPASVPSQAVAAVDSTSGSLHVELRSVPDPMVRGQKRRPRSSAR